ncbi:hypothetical protein N7448_009955 [Penicillium atrosanguineum]|uniref:Uncharacterized protein n=1 Tax=Penicillium atrosanguineum TaxID=1132637 RepID=A0A9W9KSH5_9EURO|nr:Acyl-CoA N-acyltransferase [Penicillium atrosanguineum]KAJ5118240.1 hypothetical protein N7526_009877 [Penicillium atrosanguineum]KAJ5119286.1 hypothetical protein N7448_009955 [Penicillium atrosanguineum]KAJ5296277.1 Acyl-CoA N-acyltransferase [Penicillium atrosanguineum]KAJ5299048.1 hypothetical protein N7476_010605 [Penicillium atrosanguineum]
MSNSPTIVKIPWDGVEGEPIHIEDLQSQLQNIPRDTRYLRIDEDAPSADDWALLGSHFTGVENLELESGFNEDLRDQIPLHWPLQRLELRSAIAEVITTPFIREGRVPHLSLLLTCGLRFEGPTSDELQMQHEEAVKRGDNEEEFFTVGEGTPEERKIQVTFLPTLVCDWMNDHFCGADSKKDRENKPSSCLINMETLEIFENDAMDAFSRMAMALPHIVSNLRTLRIRSTSGLDFHYLTEEAFRYTLPTLENLETFNFTVGEVFDDPTYLPTLHKFLPPNLTTLYIRGPTSLCQSEQWSDWLKSFESDTFLPKLQKMAFILDLHYGDVLASSSRRKNIVPPSDALEQAREACRHLCDIAQKRGISIVDMPVEHINAGDLFMPVDPRW